MWQKLVAGANDKICRQTLLEPTKIDIQVPPEGMTFQMLNITNKNDRVLLTNFLNDHYYEGENFRIKINDKQLRWMLSSDYTLCLGLKNGDDLVGCICGMETNMRVHVKQFKMIDVLFLCLNNDFRGKKLTSLLVNEFIRVCNLSGYQYGYFHSKKEVGYSMTQTTNYNRALNIVPLIESGFMSVPKDVKIKDVDLRLQLPNNPINGEKFIKMEESHIDQAYNLYTQYVNKYKAYRIFTKDQFKNRFFDNKFMTTYVLVNDNNDVRDFIAYYKQTIHINKKVKYDCIRNAVLYFYTSKSETSYRLIKDMLIIAKNEGIDLFTMNDSLENEFILHELFFDKSPNTYHHYLYKINQPQFKSNIFAITPF